jgi:diguanylate cyclase (GGDEF)-like protein
MERFLMPSVDSIQPSASGVNEIRVLIVEDCEHDAYLLTLQLARCGLKLVHQRVDTAADMRKALLGSEWDIVISDHAMPGFSSRAALAVLQSTGRDIPFIVYSGRIPEDVASAILHDGASDCIIKGDVGRLVPAIERELTACDAPLDETPAMRLVAVPAGSGAPAVRSRVTSGDYDRLTGLHARDGFLRLAPGALAESRPGEQAVVCFIDFSRFMRVNETFGYSTGDALLAQIGIRLNEYAHKGFAARFGGNEFVVFEGGFTNEDSVHRFVQGLSTELAQPYTHKDLELHIASSMGVSVYPECGTTLPELVLNAETALHQCKRLMGRDAYLFYFPELNPVRGEHMLLESALWQALRRGELRLYYQPCVSLSTGRVSNVEALVRWQHPELGLLAPERFLPLAHECGLMGEIDGWVLREASRQGSIWRASGHSHFSVAVNVSATEFGHPRLLGRAAMALRESGMAPETLEIEITESALVQDTATTIATLQALRKMGIKIAIDDFGTGYSSLAYLKRFPVDILKIDKSFVKNIAVDKGDAAIARTIIDLAQNFDLTVHAEGVETQQQLDFLARRGCDRAQGFLFARPIPSADVLPLIRRLEADPKSALDAELLVSTA